MELPDVDYIGYMVNIYTQAAGNVAWVCFLGGMPPPLPSPAVRSDEE